MKDSYYKPTVCFTLMGIIALLMLANSLVKSGPEYAAAQSSDSVQCVELKGGIKAISAFLHGVYQGLEGDVADPGAQKVLNAPKLQ
jgi:hypothetical protein